MAKSKKPIGGLRMQKKNALGMAPTAPTAPTAPAGLPAMKKGGKVKAKSKGKKK